MNFQVQITGLEKTLQAIKTVKDEQLNVSTGRFRDLVARLMTEGYEIAQAGFANAQYAGENDVVVAVPVWRGNTLVLSAHGNAVAFIEFGTGTFYQPYPDSEMASRAGVVPRGEYGKKKGRKPPWRYVGVAGNAGVVKHHKSDGTDVVETYGNPPARAMYEASKVFNQDHVMEVAREVLRHD